MMKSKPRTLGAGQYFEIRIEYVDITQEEFGMKIGAFENNLKKLFKESKDLEIKISDNLKAIKYD